MKTFRPTALSAAVFAALFPYTASAADSIPFDFVVSPDSEYSADQIYIGVVGYQDDGYAFLDLDNNFEINKMDASDNTLADPTGSTSYTFIDMFKPLSEIDDLSISMPQFSSVRIYIGLGSPLYIRYDTLSDSGGYVAPTINNSGDVNYGLRFELVELTYNDYGLWVNTTRVDSYQYPMGLQVWGDDYYKAVGELLTHEEITNLWESTYSGTAFSDLYITDDSYNYDVILNPSHHSSFSSSGGDNEDYFDNYVEAVWTRYADEKLCLSIGEAGKWVGQVNSSGQFIFTEYTNSYTDENSGCNDVSISTDAMISGAPSTYEILSASGVLAEDVAETSTTYNDQNVQKHFAAAFNRGVIDLDADLDEWVSWGDEEDFFNNAYYGHNEYVEFWHDDTISFEGETYAFAYDDVFDYSSTIHTTDPELVQVTIGGFSAVEMESIEDDSDALVDEDDANLIERIEAEDYTEMSGVQTESTSDSGGGDNVGWIDSGDWMTYSLEIAEAGTYRVDFRLASPVESGSFDVLVDGEQQASVDVENTGTYQSWETQSIYLDLGAGEQTLTLEVTGSSWNINWIEIYQEVDSETDTDSESESDTDSDTITDSDSDTDTDVESDTDSETDSDSDTDTEVDESGDNDSENDSGNDTDTETDSEDTDNSGSSDNDSTDTSDDSETVTVNVDTLYLIQESAVNTLSESAGSSTTGATITGDSSSDAITFVYDNLSAAYDGDAMNYNLCFDTLSSTVATAPKLTVSYDFDGDGSADRVETAGYFALDPVADSWECWSNEDKAYTATGDDYQDFEGGSITLSIWNALGDAGTTEVKVNAADDASYIDLPYDSATQSVEQEEEVSDSDETSSDDSSEDSTSDSDTDQSNDDDSADSNGWELVWQDEFDSSEVDTTKWDFEENCWGGGNNEQQCYTAREDNAYIEDSVLYITAIEESYTGAASTEDSASYDINDTTTLPYTSARLRTKNLGDWTYGRFEISAKLPSGQGTWPAIWMLPTDAVYGTWAASGEIDIMEAVNLGTVTNGEEEKDIHGTLHYGAVWPSNVSSGSSYQLPDDASPADDFHEYAIEWEEGEIRWYVDDVLYATQTSDDWYTQYEDENGDTVYGTGAAPFDERFHLLLNLAVGGDWAANVNETGIDSDAFPAQLAVDYVRVYQCSSDPETGSGCTGPSDEESIATDDASEVEESTDVEEVTEVEDATDVDESTDVEEITETEDATDAEESTDVEESTDNDRNRRGRNR